MLLLILEFIGLSLLIFIFLTQIVITPFIGKRLFWLFRSSTWQELKMQRKLQQLEQEEKLEILRRTVERKQEEVWQAKLKNIERLDQEE